MYSHSLAPSSSHVFQQDLVKPTVVSFGYHVDPMYVFERDGKIRFILKFQVQVFKLCETVIPRH